MTLTAASFKLDRRHRSRNLIADTNTWSPRVDGTGSAKLLRFRKTRAAQCSACVAVRTPYAGVISDDRESNADSLVMPDSRSRSPPGLHPRRACGADRGRFAQHTPSDTAAEPKGVPRPTLVVHATRPRRGAAREPRAKRRSTHRLHRQRGATKSNTQRLQRPGRLLRQLDRANSSVKPVPRDGIEPPTRGFSSLRPVWPRPRKTRGERVVEESTAAHLQQIAVLRPRFPKTRRNG